MKILADFLKKLRSAFFTYSGETKGFFIKQYKEVFKAVKYYF